MEESILLTIKRLLGVPEDSNAFDTDIITSINTSFMILNQLGVGSKGGFFITGEDEVWSDIVGDSKDLESVKTYVHLRTRKIFDPPSSSTAMSAIDDFIKELEWRINVQIERKAENE